MCPSRMYPCMSCPQRIYADLRNTVVPKTNWETKVKRFRTDSIYFVETVELCIKEVILSSTWCTIDSSTLSVQQGVQSKNRPREKHISSRQLTFVLIDGYTKITQ
jgi:hypothetical protein